MTSFIKFPSVTLWYINHYYYDYYYDYDHDYVVSPDVRDAYFGGSMDKAFEGFSYVNDSSAHLLISKHKKWVIVLSTFSAHT